MCSSDLAECKEYLYKKICDDFIMKYKSPEVGSGDDISYDSEAEGLDE